MSLYRTRFVDELGTRDHLVARMRAADPGGPLCFALVMGEAAAARTAAVSGEYVARGLLRRFETLAELERCP